MDLSSTHIPYLALAVLKFGDPILEIGCGPYSTPLLRSLSKQVRSIEREAEWVSKIETSFGIKVLHTPDMAAAVSEQAKEHWRIVFVDCHREDRPNAIEAFSQHETVIVIHDTEVDYLKEIVGKFKYQRTFSEIWPWTSWVSNLIDVSAL